MGVTATLEEITVITIVSLTLGVQAKNNLPNLLRFRARLKFFRQKDKPENIAHWNDTHRYD